MQLQCDIFERADIFDGVVNLQLVFFCQQQEGDPAGADDNDSGEDDDHDHGDDGMK